MGGTPTSAAHAPRAVARMRRRERLAPSSLGHQASGPYQQRTQHPQRSSVNLGLLHAALVEPSAGTQLLLDRALRLRGSHRDVDGQTPFKLADLSLSDVEVLLGYID